MSGQEIAFDKYAAKGAYHWTELEGPIHRRNAYTAARYDIVCAALVRHGLAPGGKVLDIGCGDGALTGLIARRLRAEVAGIDTVPQALALAREQFARRGLTGRFEPIEGYVYPFADAAFDAIVCSDVIEHVREPAALLREAWRVLAPGGVLAITTPVRYTEAPLDRMHVQEFFPGDLERLSADTLGVAVAMTTTHPAALAELYALPTMLGRVVRLIFNLAATGGRNPFLTMGAFRAPSTQMMVAIKPKCGSAR